MQSHALTLALYLSSAASAAALRVSRVARTPSPLSPSCSALAAAPSAASLPVSGRSAGDRQEGRWLEQVASHLAGFPRGNGPTIAAALESGRNASQAAEDQWRHWIQGQLNGTRGAPQVGSRGPVRLHANSSGGRRGGQPIAIPDQPGWLPRRLAEEDGAPVSPECLVVGGVHYSYLLPAKRKHAKPRGTFLLLHSCGRHSLDWFRDGGKTDGLIIGGLVEESIMASAILERGFAVIAPDARDQRSSCWWPASDGAPLAQSLPVLLALLGLDKAALYGVGTSSGGIQLAALVKAHGMKFEGLVFNVSPGAGGMHGPGRFAEPGWPRTAFVHMPPDIYTWYGLGVKSYAAALRGSGTQVRTFEVLPTPLNELESRAPLLGLGQEVVCQLVHKLVGWRVTQVRGDPPRLYIKVSGPNQAYYRLTQGTAHLGNAWLRLVRQLVEELRAFEGIHAPTSQYFEDQVLPFLLGQGAASAKVGAPVNETAAAPTVSEGAGVVH